MTKKEADDFSFTTTVLAIDDTIDWIENAKEVGYIRPPKGLINLLKKYRARCSKEVHKKPFGWG